MYRHKSNFERITFTLSHSVIGPENLGHPLNQSNAKLKPVATWSLRFSDLRIKHAVSLYLRCASIDNL